MESVKLIHPENFNWLPVKYDFSGAGIDLQNKDSVIVEK